MPKTKSNSRHWPIATNKTRALPVNNGLKLQAEQNRRATVDCGADKALSTQTDKCQWNLASNPHAHLLDKRAALWPNAPTCGTLDMKESTAVKKKKRRLSTHITSNYTLSSNTSGIIAFGASSR
jgi:hypothetical protein